MEHLHTATWDEVRAHVIARDGSRCTVGWLLGGACSDTLDVHHLIPREEGGTNDPENLITACHAHHPVVEALRRRIRAASNRCRSNRSFTSGPFLWCFRCGWAVENAFHEQSGFSTDIAVIDRHAEQRSQACELR